MKTFRFKKVNGTADFDFITESVRRIVQFVPNGEYMVQIQKHVNKRSVSQNALMWLWFACIAHEFSEFDSDTNYTKEDVYDLLTFKFLKTTKIINGEPVTVIKSTSKLNVDEFTKFLNQIQAYLSSEYGIILPNPDDKFWDDFFEMYKNS